MAFPTALGGFFNFATIFYVFRGVGFNNLNLTRTLKWLILISTIFLFLQSGVVSQRRVLFSYTIFYIVAAISYKNTVKKTRGQLNLIILTTYLITNLLALLFTA